MIKRPKNKRRSSFSPHISRILSAGVVITLLIVNLMPPSAKQRAETSRKQEASLAAIAKYASVSGEISRWEKILAQNPGYRDGYLVQSINYWRLFDESNAKNYWREAFNLDPNNEDVAKIKQVLQF